MPNMFERFNEHTTNRRQQLIEVAQVAGAVTFAIVATPIEILDGLKKRASQSLQSANAMIDERTSSRLNAIRLQQEPIALPPQLLGDVVVVERIEHPLLSEAYRK